MSDRPKSWNFRLTRRTYDGEVQYAIREVYYNADGIPVAATVNPVPVTGETADEVVQDLMRMLAACSEEDVVELDESGVLAVSQRPRD